MPNLWNLPFKFIDSNSPLSKLAADYLQALLERERHRASDMIFQAVEDGRSIKDIYLQVFQPVQYEIGWLWQSGLISVGHEHYCTNSTQFVMARLYPVLFAGSKGGRRILATCVQGELHEIGMRMLADFFEMEGWNSDYLGANTPRESIVAALEEKSTSLLAVGVTMHYHLEEAQRLIAAVRRSPRLDGVKIMVGGYTFRTVAGLWEKLGADGTATDAARAIELAGRLTGKDA